MSTSISDISESRDNVSRTRVSEGVVEMVQGHCRGGMLQGRSREIHMRMHVGRPSTSAPEGVVVSEVGGVGVGGRE